MKNDQDSSEAAARHLEDVAEQYGLDIVWSVDAGLFDPAFVEHVPVEWARTRQLLPLRINGEACVLTADPKRVDEREYLSILIGEDLRPVLAPPAVIKEAIEQCYYSRDESPRDVIAALEGDRVHGAAVRRRSDDLLEASEQAPVTQLVNRTLLEAVKMKASDVHFEPYEDSVRVRYRIDGELYEQGRVPKGVESALVSRLKVMAHMDIAERRLPQDGTARVRVGQREIDIRLSTIPVAEGERVVLRLLDRESALLPLDVLGMSESTLVRFRRLLTEPNGIIVVSGPTGSGKTTTLYAALGELDAGRKNILTIEDPVEYQIPNIGQVQVKPKIGLTFASGLRHVLRQDPDVVLVGETRDIETAEIAIRAALTGHLVFTTLHTNDAVGAIPRLLDMGVEPYLLSACLRGVLAQRLVRCLCPHCKKKASVTAEQRERMGETGNDLGDGEVWDAVGCERCIEGYRGRSGLFELLTVDERVSEAMRKTGGDAAELRRAAEKAGMTSLGRDGVQKVLSGVTSIPEVVKVL